MQAMKFINHDNNGLLFLDSCKEPTVKQGEVLIEVKSAGVNRADIFQAIGKYPPPEGASMILGMEFSGIRQDNQQRVMGLVDGGAYAEYCSAPILQLIEIPDNFSFEMAAALPEAFFTCWFNIFMKARLKKGETLLVHGGGSGIGTTAIMLAKAFECEVVVTAGSDEKCKRCLEVGADKAINYKTSDFANEVQADVILDIAGASYFQQNINCLKQNGRLVILSMLGGRKSEIDIATIHKKNLTIMGSTLRSQTTHVKAEICAEIKQKVMPLVESGQIKPVIDSIFSFEDANSAHERMRNNLNFGKIVLKN